MSGLINISKTKEKLKKLSYKDIELLKKLISEEESNRIGYSSNLTDHPDKIKNELSSFFANAWIH